MIAGPARRLSRTIRFLPASALLAVAMLAAPMTACGAQDAPESAAPREAADPANAPPLDAGNLLADPSFELAESEVWFHLADQNPAAWVGFEVNDRQAHDGRRAAMIELDSEANPGPTRVHGIVQDILVEEGEPLMEVPERLTGWYYVEGWERGTVRQYIQIVLSIKPKAGEGERRLPTQLAVVLAGVDRAPIRVANRRFTFNGPVEPVQGQWVYFDIPVREQFQEQWDMTMDDIESIRVFLEARYDKRDPSVDKSPAKGRVWFDAVRLGD